MRCHDGKHDLRFVYQLPDLVDKLVVYDKNDVPTVTESRGTHFECRACLRPIEPIWDAPRTYTPEPARVLYSKRGGTTYEYDA